MPKNQKGLDKVIISRWVHLERFSYRSLIDAGFV